MTPHATLGVAVIAFLIATGARHPTRAESPPTATLRAVVAPAQPGDTATVTLHIPGMTCGSCPLTARTALKKPPGVIDAKVTLVDSLGVIRYDPRKLSAPQIAAQLTGLTGYGARIIERSK